MPFIELPSQLPERVMCSITAAVKYDVPANIVLAVAEEENGKPGQWVKNSNGTDDVGVMQFNTSYLYDLRKYGITPNDVAQKGCYPFDLAAWRLRGHIQNDKGDIWTRAADYHSRTPEYNSIYRTDLIRKASKWENWLEARFLTYDINTPRALLRSAQPVVDTGIMEMTPVATKSTPVNLSYSSVDTYAIAHHYNIAAARALAAEFSPKSLDDE
jgi:hypothetical protein